MIHNVEGGLRVEGLRKLFRGRKAPALADISLAVTPGETLGLVGPNGAGKTTFLGCLLGLLHPTAGSVLIGGLPPDDLSVRRATGYVPERLSFDRWMSGRSFVVWHAALAGIPRPVRREKVEGLLERVALDRTAWDRPLRMYSRGMLQRLGLAQALIASPRFLLLDEPTSGLDPEGVLHFRRILLDLKADGVTIVLNSHQLDQVERVADRVAFLRAGRIESVEDLKRHEKSSRVLSLRWLPAQEVSEAALPAAVSSTGAVLLDRSEREATVRVEGDEAAARLIGALGAAGFRIVEASADRKRLERLFEPATGAAA